MPGHVSHNCSSVGLVDDQQVIQPFPADGADESFGELVRPRRPHRRANHPGAARREDTVEAGGRTSRPDQRIKNLNRPPDSPRSMSRGEEAQLLGSHPVEGVATNPLSMRWTETCRAGP